VCIVSIYYCLLLFSNQCVTYCRGRVLSVNHFIDTSINIAIKHEEMGNTFRKLFDSLFGNREMRVVMLGKCQPPNALE